ncbi:hypothetical protein RDWZM_007319 [Blomia tropicalis]|uniref:Uncharacterized protein n=1 Tax=Blomia tropicalis TaxID=40697 RepID=A0A9Q0M1H5_BLOTA|nr:hypothetical protein RDWZM_007319 [Blomia tropicalis]
MSSAVAATVVVLSTEPASTIILDNNGGDKMCKNLLTKTVMKNNMKETVNDNENTCLLDGNSNDENDSSLKKKVFLESTLSPSIINNNGDKNVQQPLTNEMVENNRHLFCDTPTSNSFDTTQYNNSSNIRFSFPSNNDEDDDGKEEDCQFKNDENSTMMNKKKSILVNQSQSYATDYNRPPDGGWGWVVVFASFMINLIADGISLSFGVIFPELVEYFGESKSKTSLVGSLLLSIPLITGPIASALTDHFGCRKMAIVGSVFSSLGFFLSSFCNQIEYLFFTFSLSGFGIALCSVTSIVSVAYYFEKRRSLATGLSLCGTGLGTFLFSPLITYLLEEFKWHGTLLILAGIFLNISCFGLLIRDLDLDGDNDNTNNSSSSSHHSSHDDSSSDIDSNVIDSDTNSIQSGLNCINNHNHHSIEHAIRHGLSCVRTDNSPIASKHISFGKTTRIRHKSDCDPELDSIPRTYTSLINIPTYIKNAANDALVKHSKDNQQSTRAVSNLNDDLHQKKQKQTNEELIFRRGGYLHSLITYYPHLLSLFLPWDLECNDLTVKTVPPLSSTMTDASAVDDLTLQPHDLDEPELLTPKSYQNHQVDLANSEPTTTLANTSPSRDSSFVESCHNRQNSVAIPVQVPPRYNDLINFGPGRLGGGGRLARIRGHRHRLHHQHHQFNHAEPLNGGGHTLHNLRLQRGSLTYRSAMLIISKYKLKASSAPDIYRTSMATINEDKGFTVFGNIKEIICDMFDLSSFKSTPYTIFCLSNFLLYVCIDIPYVYLVDQAITSGTFDKETASLLISIIGVFNTIGVVIIGYIGDKPWLDANMVYAFFITLCGISFAAIPLCTEPILTSTMTAIYGLTISANYSLVSVILVEFISLDSFTQAYGLLLLVQGVGSLVGPPIVGWLFDVLGSYSEAFYLTGMVVFISGLFVIPVSNRRNCFFWSYQMSRSGSSISLVFKPLSFVRNGVYGKNVCSKRNIRHSIEVSKQSPLINSSIVEQNKKSIHVYDDNNSQRKNKSKNCHHVVIIEDEDSNKNGKLNK